MIGRVMEIVESDRHLSLEYGNVLVRQGNDVVGSVALDDIQALIINPHGATVSAGILAALAERGTPVIISSPSFRPVAAVVPIVGHHAISQRLEAQVGASQPARMQAWKQIVRSKVSMQPMVLEQWGHDATALWDLEARARSGDPGNLLGSSPYETASGCDAKTRLNCRCSDFGGTDLKKSIGAKRLVDA